MILYFCYALSGFRIGKKDIGFRLIFILFLYFKKYNWFFRHTFSYEFTIKTI